MNDYAQYEKDSEAIRKANKQLLTEFSAWLKTAGLAAGTIKNHCANIEFYVNEFLLYEEAMEAKDGVTEVDAFLGYWFIQKAMWSSQASIKSNAASLKKFYTFLYEKGLIDKQALADLKEDIKDGLPLWLATLARYEDPDEEEVW
jgi:site-specific recombinase XerD